MITSVTIKNFKSIADATIELGRFNVFIGANGTGKSNLLEAIAMFAALGVGRTEPADLFERGMRATRTRLMLSAFAADLAQTDGSVTINSDSVHGLLSVPRTRRMLPLEETQQNARWRYSKTQFGIEEANFVALVETRMREALDNSAGTDTAHASSIEPIRDQVKRELFEEAKQEAVAVASHDRALNEFAVFTASTLALRGLEVSSRREPLGINGENLDVVLANLPAEDQAEIADRARIVSWFDGFDYDETDVRKLDGHKLGRSRSRLYFRDRFMRERDNVFAAESANEGILHILFYLTLFISKTTPPIFAIDNLESSLNPGLCQSLTKHLAALAKSRDKQAIVTTHSPSVLDGLNLHDDDQRLFKVFRDDDGHTKFERIKLKPDMEVGGERLKLSELWMRGRLGALPTEP